MAKPIVGTRQAFLGAAAVAALTCGITASARAADTETELPEVVVTAERTVQNLQKVPISATVLSGAELAERGVARLHDLQNVSPSLAINTINRSVFINIRGVGIAQSAPTSSPGVAVYVNGALVPHETTVGGSFYDIEAVEILRGPQGTLTGQNSTGGAIYFRTPAPNFDAYSGYLDLGLGRFDAKKGVAAVNVPIAKNLAVRLAATRDKRDSFTKNIGNPDSQPGDINFTGYRGDLRWKPYDNLDIDLRFEHFDSDTHFNAIKNRNDKVTPDPFTIEEDAQSDATVRGYRADAEVKWDFTEGLRLRYIGTQQDAKIYDLVDGDRTNTARPRPPTANVGRLGYTKNRTLSEIHEIDLISTSDSNLKWVVGGFLLEEKQSVTLARYQLDTVRITTAPTALTLIAPYNNSASVFGQVSYRFDPAWELIVGGRYSHDEQEFRRIFAPAPTGHADSNEPTGRVALNWQATSQTLVYGSVSRGYKAGGVNLTATDPPFDPEKNTVEELGFKTTVLDGRVRLNGSAFASQYRDIQLSALTPARTPTTQNLPKAKIKGFELETLGHFGNFRLNGGLSYLDGQTDVAAVLLNNTLTPSVSQPVPKGTRLPYSPKWTFNAGVEYDFELAGGRLTPRLQFNHVSTQYTALFQNGNSIMPTRDLLDARLTFAPAEAPWQVEGYVNNITNNTYIASQVGDASSQDGGYLYGAPTTYGVRLVVRWGGAM
jgi:iron complex outermembrane receptor protein